MDFHGYHPLRISPLKRGYELLVVAALLLALTVTVAENSAFAQSVGPPLSQVESAYNTVRLAERAGYNVTGLDASLNQAMGLISQGTEIETSDPAMAEQMFSQANSISTQVATSAQALLQSGLSPATKGEAYLAGGITAIAVAIVLVFLYLPTLFWSFWTRFRAGYLVSRI
jgi:hypothetical protein